MSIVTKKPTIFFILAFSITSDIYLPLSLCFYHMSFVVRRFNLAELLSSSQKKLFILLLNLHWDHPLSTYAKLFRKTNISNALIRTRTGLEMLVFWKTLRTYLIYDPIQERNLPPSCSWILQVVHGCLLFSINLTL